MNVAQYIRTVRHLRPEQVYRRVWFRIYQPRPDLRPAPARRAVNGVWKRLSWRAPARRGPKAVRFLSVTADFAAGLSWDDAHRPKLWRYNLHYFDDLNARDAQERESWHKELIERWIADNPAGGGTGWEPYPTSLRIVNWIKWELGNPSRDRQRLEQRELDSLAVQTRWLSKRLEKHLLANHLWANAKALLFAGVFFEGSEAADWLGEGLHILQRESARQILSDGGHYERSPMYHAIVLEDILDIVNLANAYTSVLPRAFADRLGALAVRMLRWLQVMSHPDGRIAFFNDAAFGIAPEHSTLTTYARDLGVEPDKKPLAALELLAESGYVRMANDLAVLICDVAPIGPDYLPAHAHADTLSFELSLHGRRVLVNGGTGTYEPGAERRRQRATASHNTVEVDGEDSSEVWSAFRVARRAYPQSVRSTQDGEALRLEGSHDGYHRLPGKVTHSRSWTMRDRELVLVDNLSGRYDSAVAFFGLHPDVGINAGEGGAILSFDAGNAAIRFSEAGTVPATYSVVESTWHPEFGVSQPRKLIASPVGSVGLTTRITW